MLSFDFLYISILRELYYCDWNIPNISIFLCSLVFEAYPLVNLLQSYQQVLTGIHHQKFHVIHKSFFSLSLSLYLTLKHEAVEI